MAARGQTRFIAQPGPALEPRILAVKAGGRAFQLRLEAGQMLLEGVKQGFSAAGFASGVVALEGLALHPFAYVMPALATTTRHAAFYSAPFRPPGISRVEAGQMTFGLRDDAPFFHAHALWHEAEGDALMQRGGHILPDETCLAAPVTLHAYGLDGAAFKAEEDAETLFKLFGPVGAPASAGPSPCRLHALRLRPNQDIHAALEAYAQQNGITRATILGGVGSIIGATFASGQKIEPFATEVFIRSGSITPQPDGALRAALEIGLVDYTGGMASGLLERGANSVLMTFELVLLET